MTKKKTIDQAPSCLNLNDKAMWLTGWNEAVQAIEQAEKVEPIAWVGEIAEGAQLLLDKPTMWDAVELYTHPAAQPVMPQGYQVIGWIDRQYGTTLHNKPAAGRQAVYVSSAAPTAPAQPPVTVGTIGHIGNDKTSLVGALRTVLVPTASTQPAVPQYGEADRVPDDYKNQDTGYRAGWNDCRSAMLSVAPAQPIAEIVCDDSGYLTVKLSADYTPNEFDKFYLHPAAVQYWTPEMFAKLDALSKPLIEDDTPAPQPLPEDAIMGATRSICREFRWPSTAIDVWRLAEQAHGIKGETK